MRTQLSKYALTLVLGALLLAGDLMASVIAVSPSAFPGGSTVLNFNGLASGTEVNGLIVSGVLFGYSLGNGGLIIADGGPGITNNVNPPNILSTGDPPGVLTITFPSLINMFGYGYAVFATSSVPNATTIDLFNGATPVGTLSSFDAVPDPRFAGGFAGISSTLAFNRAHVTFSPPISDFALDNLTFAAVPEPSPILLMPIGLSVLVWLRSAAARKSSR